MPRHCAICGYANCCLNYPISCADLSSLTAAGYIRHSVRDGAVHLRCGACNQLTDGFQERLESYALMASAGHLVSLRRLFPDLDGLHDARLKDIDIYLAGPNFAVKHGAPDYRLDRTTLQLTGSCREFYERGAGEWQTDYHFLTWFSRTVCNDSIALDSIPFHGLAICCDGYLVIAKARVHQHHHSHHK